VNQARVDWRMAAEELGLLQLRNDPQYPRIPADRRTALVEAALNDGRSLADRTREQWGDVPSIVAARCDVPVIRSEGDAGFGSVVVYADYAPLPPSITLYLPAIRTLDRLIARHSAQACAIGSTVPIFLAHELYHHFDCLRGGDHLSRRHTVKIFGVGSWHWTSGLSSLAEIAAGAFAQQLLGLPFHPKVLDFLSVQTVNHGEHGGEPKTMEWNCS
jgi:predicted Zn-dependent protease with MMP-like domain